jgi:hypothetical protein
LLYATAIANVIGGFLLIQGALARNLLAGLSNTLLL